MLSFTCTCGSPILFDDMQCGSCRAEIGYERLRANPGATRCVTCQTRYEKTHAGPGAPKL